MNFEEWWNNEGKKTSNHKGIAKRAYEASRKNINVPTLKEVMFMADSIEVPELSYTAKIYLALLNKLGLEGKCD